jgi:hypothetical protein
MNKKIETRPGGLEYESELDESVAETKPQSHKLQRRSSKKKRDPLNGQVLWRFSKEALDVLRAFVTVAIICYAATKNPAWYLTALAVAAKIALGTTPCPISQITCPGSTGRVPQNGSMRFLRSSSY